MQVDGRCPRCSSTKLHRSMHHGKKEWLITRVLGRRYMRCESCAYRFLVPKNRALERSAKGAA